MTDTAHPTMPPNTPGAQDECATCGHARWRHKEVDGQQVCTEHVQCACGGHFVEMSMATRMARFVEAAQKLPPAMAAVRAAMTEAFRAFHGMHTAMQQAGLLPEDAEPGLCDGCDTVTQVTATDDGRAQMCDSCKRAMANAAQEEAARALCPIDGAPLATAHAQAGRPTMYQHRDGFMHPDRTADLEVGHRVPAFQQLTAFHHVDCDGTDRTVGGACAGACTQGRDATEFTQDPDALSFPSYWRQPAPPVSELATSSRYARQASESCSTCWPYACELDDNTGQRRSQCRRPRNVDVTHCPKCRHPWSYITDGACTMPVLPGTNIPPSRTNQDTDRCGCTTPPPASVTACAAGTCGHDACQNAQQPPEVTP